MVQHLSFPMSHPSSYPSPPYAFPESFDPLSITTLLASTWHVLDQPPPPTLREILNAYRSKGDGDRDMLLAMLNAKTAEDQRIAAVATLHQKMLDIRASSRLPPHDHASAPASYEPPSFAHAHAHAPPLPRMSPTTSPKDVTLPSIHASANPRKRARPSQSPPPLLRRPSGPQPLPASDQLPPSPPFSSPGRSTSSAAELHPQAQARAMAIGSLLTFTASHQHDADAEWPSRMSAERTGSASGDREAYRRQSNKGSSG